MIWPLLPAAWLLRLARRLLANPLWYDTIPWREEDADVTPPEGTLAHLDHTLQNLWDTRRKIDTANDALIDALATRQREFMRALCEDRMVPPSDEVMRENHRRSTA